jgi:hypothetical protein
MLDNSCGRQHIGDLRARAKYTIRALSASMLATALTSHVARRCLYWWSRRSMSRRFLFVSKVYASPRDVNLETDASHCT